MCIPILFHQHQTFINHTCNLISDRCHMTYHVILVLQSQWLSLIWAGSMGTSPHQCSVQSGCLLASVEKYTDIYMLCCSCFPPKLIHIALYSSHHSGYRNMLHLNSANAVRPQILDLLVYRCFQWKCLSGGGKIKIINSLDIWYFKIIKT